MSVTLLLADDSITIQRVIELTFADENVRVIAASDGQQAIQRIEAERPDIVLADVSMPKIDGYGVAAHVKQSPALRHIPVLLLTGAFEPIDEAKARATGCDGILVKPFKPEELIKRVRELVAGQRSDGLWPEELPRVEPRKPVAAPVPVFAPPPMPLPKPLSVAPQPPVVDPPSVPHVVVSRVTRPPAAPTPAMYDAPLDADSRTDRRGDARIERRAGTRSNDDGMPTFATRQTVDEQDITQPIDHLFDEAAPAVEQDDLRPATRPQQPAQPSQMSRTQLVPRDLPPPADAFESELDMLDVALSRLEPSASPHELDAATASDFARDLQALRSEQPDGTIADEAENRMSGAAGHPMFGDWDLPAKRSSSLDSDNLDIDLDVTEPIDVFVEELPHTPQTPARERTPEPESDAVAPPPTPVIVMRPTLVAVPPLSQPSADANDADDDHDEPLPVFTTVRTGPVAVPPPTPAAPSAAPVFTVVPSTPVAPPPAAPLPAAAAAPAAPAEKPAPRPSLASAFSALLAAERAQPPARELSSSATLSESAIEDVVKRVLARMTDQAVHKVVLDAAERIIREEIDRLKPQTNSGPQADR